MPNHLPDPLTASGRELRGNSTEAEKKLWYRLRARQLAGQKFRRQYPLQSYILDFACEEKRLGVELDGGQHNEAARATADAARTAALEEKGWRVLRFWNHEVVENVDGVLVVIEHWLTLKSELSSL